MTTSSDLPDRVSELREEFWRGVGEPGTTRGPLGEVDDAALWPTGVSAYRRVSTAHAQIITTDGMSDPHPSSTAGGAPGLGIELYVESIQLGEDDPGEGRWLVDALEECAGAVAGAGVGIAGALDEYGVLSLEVSGDGAPGEWGSEGPLGLLLGVRLPGRSTGFDVDGARVHALSVTPLRPAELAVITSEGPQGRRRVAEALVESRWYSYADSERPAVL